MKEKILIVEDDKDMCRLVEYNLGKAQYRTISAVDGEQGLNKALKELPDLIILDIMLPKMDGLEVCRALKRDSKTSSIPILMLTAKAEEVDKIVGLEMGADDYVTKPFSPRELVARVATILRRTRPAPAAEVFKKGTLEVDFTKYTAKFKGEPVELTAKEFALLKALLDANGRALSRDFLLENVWGSGYRHEHEVLRVTVWRLRQKLEDDPQRPRFIATVPGVGYLLNGAA